MPIAVKLDDLLHDRRLTLTELADRVGMTLANLSILKTGKARSIRFSTLEAICGALSCQPGDILRFETKAAARACGSGRVSSAGDHLERDIVEDVEVARESGRVVGRMEQDTAGEMALLRTVGRENGWDVLLERCERHRARSRAAIQASRSPYSRSSAKIEVIRRWIRRVAGVQPRAIRRRVIR